MHLRAKVKRQSQDRFHPRPRSVLVELLLRKNLKYEKVRINGPARCSACTETYEREAPVLITLGLSGCSKVCQRAPLKVLYCRNYQYTWPETDLYLLVHG